MQSNFQNILTFFEIFRYL
ncbi:hypothetical protein FWK35_00030663 [Aphis craccivora]|uniref:Uncharacterized protein n=1 Tax=Aphis craccivora TaxID=307492 RepID=A0A6G0ZD94_APHCR|nr:hypothetical protein FWK35_00030663 [Aphis craccivora]